MLVVPAMPSGTPATMMTRWPGLGKAVAERNASRRGRPCRRGRARLRRPRNARPTPTDSLRPVARFGVIATTGGFGRSRATRIAVEPERGPADDRRQVERLGDLPRGVRDGVADRRSPARRRCAVEHRRDRSDRAPLPRRCGSWSRPLRPGICRRPIPPTA